MEEEAVVRSLLALAQSVRLRVFRALVAAGPEGMTPGALCESLGVAATGLSFHLKELARAGLVSQERQGRYLIYRASFGQMDDLLGYLTDNCCQGQPCAVTDTLAAALKERMLAAVLIFVFTLVLVIWQPRGLGIGWSASLGALLALLLGVVRLADVALVWGIVWNATGTFIAIIVISLLLDEAGFFEWAALHVARWGGGSGRRLFAFIVLLGAAVSALFANDGAALILTPIVMAMLLALGFTPAATLAFVMAAGFIADTASLPLVVSNLVNIVSADFFKVGFGAYAAVMVPVNVAAVAASLLALLLYFRRAIPARYDLAQLKAPAAAIRDAPTFRAGWAVLALLLAGFFWLEPLGVPVSAVAAAGAAVLLAVAGRGTAISTRKVLRGAPWQIVLFSLGMYLVVYGMGRAGLTHHVAALLDVFAQGGVWGAALGTGVLSAVLSSVMNNMPTVLIGALSIDASGATGAVKQAMVYANVIGCDLGPKITPIGSLATLLWLHVLAAKGTAIGWGYYCRVGIVLTVPVLLATLAALALRLSL